MPTEKKTNDLTLLQKLAEISKSVDFLKKEAEGYKFKYVAGIQILPIIKSKMDELGVLLIPNIAEKILHPNGTVELKMHMIWKNINDSQDSLSVPWCAFGHQKDPAQAFGSALTYSERYFPLKFFHIPTDEDDPDGRTPENNKPQQETEYDKVKREIMAMARFLAKDMDNPEQGAVNFWKEAGSFMLNGEKKIPPDDINRIKPEKVEWLKKNAHAKLKKQIENLGFKIDDVLKGGK